MNNNSPNSTMLTSAAETSSSSGWCSGEGCSSDLTITSLDEEVQRPVDEEELDADVVQQLRNFGVRFIGDLRAYRSCRCPVPWLVAQQFREASDSPTSHFGVTGSTVPICFQVVPSREDFVQDPYGDLMMQDFFVARDSRGSAFGVLHFGGTFANIEYDAMLRVYRVLNVAGKPCASLQCREPKDVFKVKLVEFVSEYMTANEANLTRNCCPRIHREARLRVLSYPRLVQDEDSRDEAIDTAADDEPPCIEDSARAETPPQKAGLIGEIIRQREVGLPVAFPCYLLYQPNWLVHTTAELYEHLESRTDLRSVVTSLGQLRNMADSEICAEDELGQVTAPNVIPYQALLKTRPTRSEPTSPFRPNTTTFMDYSPGRRSAASLMQHSKLSIGK